MAVRVWFEQDIRNALSAVALASKLVQNPSTREDMEFLRGFSAAVEILSAAFGIPVQELESSVRNSFLLPDLTSSTRYVDSKSGD